MKKFLYIAVIGLITMSCSSGGDDPEPDPGPGPGPNPGANTAPTIPVLAEPSNNFLCIDNDLTFSWQAATDAEGDNVKYTIEVSLNNDFTQITHSINNITGTSKAVLLEKDKAYYWRVKASDSKNASSEFSAPFQLYTEGLGKENHLPFAPSLFQPALNASVQGNSVPMEWSATDPDGDSLTFDIYLDTNPSPTTKIVSDHPSKDYVAASLVAGKTYYWKVVVKDGKGGVTKGQVWSFSTI